MSAFFRVRYADRAEYLNPPDSTDAVTTKDSNVLILVSHLDKCTRDKSLQRYIQKRVNVHMECLRQLIIDDDEKPKFSDVKCMFALKKSPILRSLVQNHATIKMMWPPPSPTPNPPSSTSDDSPGTTVQAKFS